MTKAETITRRVSALRQWLRANGLSAYIFPSTDPHSGEYVPDHWKSREWISGFDGSAGTALVTLHHAALWTDSRYWLAAEEQTAGTPFEVIRCKRNGPTAEEVVAWLAEHETEALTDDTTSPAMGFNGWTLSEEYADALAWIYGKFGANVPTAEESATPAAGGGSTPSAEGGGSSGGT